MQKVFLSNNPAKYATSLDGSKPTSAGIKTDGAATNKRTQSTKGGSFTGNLWRNWTLIEGRFKGRAAAEFRGSGPAGAQQQRSLKASEPLVLHQVSYTRSWCLPDKIYLACISLFICSAHKHPHAHTPEKHQTQRSPLCGNSSNARSQKDMYLYNVLVCNVSF